MPANLKLQNEILIFKKFKFRLWKSWWFVKSSIWKHL